MKSILAKAKEVFWAFVDLEKAYDRIDRDRLRLCGPGGRLLKGVKSFCMNSRACVMGNGVSDWFPVPVDLWQGGVMSPWLFKGRRCLPLNE